MEFVSIVVSICVASPLKARRAVPAGTAGILSNDACVFFAAASYEPGTRRKPGQTSGRAESPELPSKFACAGTAVNRCKLDAHIVITRHPHQHRGAEAEGTAVIKRCRRVVMLRIGCGLAEKRSSRLSKKRSAYRVFQLASTISHSEVVAALRANVKRSKSCAGTGAAAAYHSPGQESEAPNSGNRPAGGRRCLELLWI